MSKFKEFRRTNGQAITVNIELIRTLESLPNGTTKIYLDEQHIVTLQDEYDKLKSLLGS